MVIIELSHEGNEGPVTYVSNKHPIGKMGVSYVETYLGCDIYYVTPPTVPSAIYRSPCITGDYFAISAVKKRICQGQGGTWDGSSCSFDEPEPEPEPAKGSITSYNSPSSEDPGDTVTVSATAKNIGTVSGSFRLRLQDRDTNFEVDSTSLFTLTAGASTTKTLSGVMPDRDWNLKLILERTLPTGAVTVDDEKKFTAINIVDWWTAFKAWWNSLATWQKALIVAGTAGGTIIGGTTLYKARMT